MNNKALQLHEEDDIAVALKNLSQSEKVELGNLELEIKEEIPAKHKFAIRNLAKGQNVTMYGEIVGQATKEISKGAAITRENLIHESSEFSIRESNYVWKAPAALKRTFLGYRREDGQVGTANYWLVFPLVFCENKNIETLKEAFEIALGYRKPNPFLNHVLARLQNQDPKSEETPFIEFESPFENVDGIRFITHQLGCGGTRQDAQTLCHLLAGYVNNPNIAGATVLSLGCQNAEFQIFQDRLNEIQKPYSKPVYLCEQQHFGTTEAFLKAAIEKTIIGLKEANEVSRTPQSISKLVIGLECGGSDGFSGISANPTLGRVSDLVIASGGSAILSEFPELFGAEQNLIDRCLSIDLAQKFAKLMSTYNEKAKSVGSGFDMNPSPGNIKDGLITDAMKSLGAAKKGGLAPVSDVLDYTEYIKKPGLNLLCTPGNDVESTTGLAGSGANLILFTTGLGTPTGNPICPVIKVSSNTQVKKRMSDIIDFDTGEIITGTKSVNEMGGELMNFVIEVASGRLKAKADLNSNFDFIPWKRGVSL